MGDLQSQLPVQCAVCRVVGLEAFGAAVRLGLDPAAALASPHQARVKLEGALRRLCPRLQDLGLLGTIQRRAVALRAVCDWVVSDPARFNDLATASAELATTIALRLGHTTNTTTTPTATGPALRVAITAVGRNQSGQRWSKSCWVGSLSRAVS
jgi:hypothetical protein